MRVVLVDPSRTAATFISRLLQARDYDVKAFADGAEALAYIKSDPDVGALITSAEPLSMSGLELCWQTRLAASNRRPIYVMMMSATDDDEKLIEALDFGADDFLSKPPVANELYARLRAAERYVTMQRELVRLATTDPLTGMFNRRAFFEQADELCAEAEAGRALSAVMMDVDHFKRVNDVYGHKVGDAALCMVAHAAMDEQAIAGRLGGEEFALLLGGGSIIDGQALAERLRVKIASLKIEAAEATLSVTCSFGVSDWRSGDSIDQLLKRADMALYEAKINGRDRVVIADAKMLAPTYSDVGRVIRASGGRKRA